MEELQGKNISEDEGELIEQEKYLSLSEHLEELRRRIFVCLFFWVVFSCLAYSRVDWFLQKVRSLAGDNFTFVYTSPTEAFMVFIKLAMVIGLIVALPIFLYETIAFINPGLKRKERRLLFSLVPSGIILFLLGSLFAWFIALPIMWKFFLSFQDGGITALWTIGEVVSFVVEILLICGIVFELPLLIVLANKLGLLPYEKMAASRRMTYFLILCITAIITPTPDAFTCLVVSVPIILLFELSLLILKLQTKRQG